MTVAKFLRILFILLILLILIYLLITRCGGYHWGGGGGTSGGGGSASSGDCADAPIGLFPSGIQSSVWSDGSVVMTIPLEDQGDMAAEDVKLTTLDLQGGSRLLPGALPLAVGQIAPNKMSVQDAHFNVPGVGKPVDVDIAGTYKVGSHACDFKLRSSITPHGANSDPVISKAGATPKVNPVTAAYPPPAQVPPGEREYNGTSVRAPMGEPRNLFPSPPPSTGAQKAQPGINPQPLPPGAAPGNTVQIITNTGGGPYNNGIPPDPDAAGPTSAASDGSQVAIYTANTGISYSINGGGSFTTVNPTSITDPSNPSRTTFFPQSDGGLCCDQVVTYVPSKDIFVWLLLYYPTPITINGKPGTSTNRMRIAWATPAAIKADFLHAWTYTDLTSATVGIGNDWIDYPDLSFSDTYLYVGADRGITNTGSVYNGQHIFVRMSLSDMVGPGPTVGNNYMVPNNNNGLVQNHIVQSSHNGMYWSAEPDTSTLVVYSWPDSSGSASAHKINISSYSNSDYTVTAPDGPDWNVAPNRALGATRTQPVTLCQPGTNCTQPDFLYFAFSAGRDTKNNRAYPYVRIEKVNTGNFTLASELDIWNPNYAFATAALGSPGVAGQDEVAISLATGGGGNYANNAVGFLNDFVVYITTNSNSTQASYNTDKNGNIIKDSNGNPTYNTRYGDYFDARNAIGPKTQFGYGTGYSTLGYAVIANSTTQNCAKAGCSANEHFILWGRPGELNPPAPPR